MLWTIPQDQSNCLLKDFYFEGSSEGLKSNELAGAKFILPIYFGPLNFNCPDLLKGKFDVKLARDFI